MPKTSAAKNEPVRTLAPGRIAWLDLEMTGLDPERDAILQAALIVTDRDLQPLEEYAVDIWQPPEALAPMVPFVRAMHEKTGLLARVADSKIDLRFAEQELLRRIVGWCGHHAVLAGNSIWNDRKFIDRHMPGLGRSLHYRMIDVSAIKVLAGLWYGDAAKFPKSEDGQHDALNDVRRSVAELRHYRRHVFSAA